ncbi:hypothetical protein AGMMS50229_20440 [Campylobacterota bacterium]|nr:hypothetical protein AGMMS50229_20440 [Campylobacterota bacterium]
MKTTNNNSAAKKFARKLLIGKTGFKSIVIDIDDTFINAVLMISSILQPNTGDADRIKIDLDDLLCVMAHKGTALISFMHAKGEKDALCNILKEAVLSPLAHFGSILIACV